MQALRPILDDLRRSGGFQFTVHQNSDGTVFLEDAKGCGIVVDYDTYFDVQSNAISTAQAVQDYAIEVGSAAWPPCPTHPDSHPLWLSEDGFYACPIDGTAHADLGQLAGSAPAQLGDTSRSRPR